jgi:hypothetical protein
VVGIPSAAGHTDLVVGIPSAAGHTDLVVGIHWPQRPTNDEAPGESPGAPDVIR